MISLQTLRNSILNSAKLSVVVFGVAILQGLRDPRPERWPRKIIGAVGFSILIFACYFTMAALGYEVEAGGRVDIETPVACLIVIAYSVLALVLFFMALEHHVF